MKISFLCFDLSDNAVGRAVLLARTLARHYPVELVGPAKLGRIWYPMEDLEIPVKKFPWKRYPAFVPVVRRMMKEIDGDILFACKLRPTSFGVGLLKKWASKKPLLVDIDDWEAGFFYHSGFWGTLGRSINFSNPNGLPYTWLMERLVGFADGVGVSNRFLEKRFSGTLLPHCRDTSILDPDRFDSDRAKEQLGLKGKKVVMFLGTPRAHKGIEDLYDALSMLDDPDLRLVIVGADRPPDFLGERPALEEERVILIPKIPFAKLPEVLAAADVVAIPQRETSDTVGQMPAKIYDAMAMAKPIVSTRVSDIPETLNDCGYLVDPENPRALADRIDAIFRNPEAARLKGRQARLRCIEFYDIKVLEERLLAMVRKAIG